MITSSGSTPSCSNNRSRSRFRRSLASHHVEHLLKRLSGRGQYRELEQAEFPEVQHDLRDAAGQEGPHRRVIGGSVGQHADEPGDLRIDLMPVIDRGSWQARRERDGRDVEDQVRRTAERGVNDHRVADRRLGEDLAERAACP